MKRVVCTFGELTVQEQTAAGGKGGTLARLYQAGYPVPEGFVILPAAFVDDELFPEAWVQVQEHLDCTDCVPIFQNANEHTECLNPFRINRFAQSC